jgi:hypothetical protein
MGLNKLNHQYDYELNVPILSSGNNSTIVNNTIGTNNISGVSNISSPPATTASASFTNTVDITGRLDVSEISERITDVVVTPSGLCYTNFNLSSIFYLSNSPTSNFAMNVDNVPTTNLKSNVASLIIPQGATGYGVSTFQINGVTQTIRWLGGTGPTPTNGAGRIDIYNFTMIRRSNSWIVIGNANQNII